MSAVFPSYCIQATGCQRYKLCVALREKHAARFELGKAFNLGLVSNAPGNALFSDKRVIVVFLFSQGTVE